MKSRLEALYECRPAIAAIFAEESMKPSQSPPSFCLLVDKAHELKQAGLDENAMTGALETFAKTDPVYVPMLNAERAARQQKPPSMK